MSILATINNLFSGKNVKILKKMESTLLAKLDRLNVPNQKKRFQSTFEQYVRLYERFKYDPLRKQEIIADWYDYMITLNDIISERNVSENEIRIEEISKRFTKYLAE